MVVRKSMFVALAVGTLATCSPLAARAVPDGVPQFVIDYAPVVRLFSTDPYRPSDISATLSNTVHQVKFVPVANVPNPLKLDNLDSLNRQGGADVYLTSIEDVTTNPAWLEGVTPDDTGSTSDATPGAVIVVDKGEGVVDAFYMYFYANNWGGEIFNFNVGNHVSDWEYNTVRFVNGTPHQIWYSQHGNGEAFRFSVVEKEGLRPVVYSSDGSHANYATIDTHDRVLPDLDLPGWVLNDYTDRGPRWDPLLNSYFFKYDVATTSFENYDSTTPVAWLNFIGKWGDEQYPDDDPRQKTLLGLARKYTSGPTGPADKGLIRKNVCPDSDDICLVRWSLSLLDAGEQLR